MNPPFAFSHDTSVTVAEVAFLLFLISGVWIAVAWLLGGRGRVGKWDQTKFRMIVAGVLIAVAGLLFIIATYWGQLFSE